MRKFWEINGKAVIKLYLNQLAMAIFGIMVIMGLGQNDLLKFLTSGLSVGLYLFIIYSMMWDEGAKAAAKTLRAEDAGVKKIKTPVLIVLFGSLFNLLCYTVYTILKIFVSVSNLTEESAVSFGGIIEIIIRMTSSIYMGFEALLFKDNVIMRTPPYYFFLTLIPLFIVGITAYYLGASEISILKRLGFNIKNKKTSNTHIDYRINKK